MSYYIIIRGPLSCGKSTISKKLAQLLNAEYIEMDEVLKDNGLDIISPELGCIPAENFIQANEIVLPRAKELLTSGTIVIFDACFYHKKVIEHLVQNLQFQHYIFTLKAPLKLCVERDSKRNKTHGEDSARAVYLLVSRFDEGHPIDVTKSLNESLKEIISYLPKPLRNYN